MIAAFINGILHLFVTLFYVPLHCFSQDAVASDISILIVAFLVK